MFITTAVMLRTSTVISADYFECEIHINFNLNKEMAITRAAAGGGDRETAGENA